MGSVTAGELGRQVSLTSLCWDTLRKIKEEEIKEEYLKGRGKIGLTQQPSSMLQGEKAILIGYLSKRFFCWTLWTHVVYKKRMRGKAV